MDYAWSGHRAYLKLAEVPWLTTNIVLKMLARGGRNPIEAYRKLMRDADEREDIERFEHSSAQEPRVLGDERFISSGAEVASEKEDRLDRAAHRWSRTDSRSAACPDALRVSPPPTVAGARTCNWHATHSRIATLAEVARRLDRDPSTLLVAVERYRVQRPDLFTETLRIS